MTRCSTTRLVRYVALLASLIGSAVALCPWKNDTLMLWSNANTWPNGQLPASGADVTITTGVLLDMQPPDLRTITVQAGGVLVWGHTNGIILNVSYIIVYGEFHVGSEDCRFKKKATINLYGLSNSSVELAGFGRKFLGVGSGGKLELHGLEKTSWTKLAHTIPRAVDLDCMVYDHSASVHGKETSEGLHVIIWTRNGTIWDYNVFDSDNFMQLADFTSELQEGDVVAAAVKTSIGSLPEDPESVYQVLESLGAKLFRSVSTDQTYAFVAKIGSPSRAVEVHLSDDPARLTVSEYGLLFLAQSTLGAKASVNFQTMNLELANPKVTVQDDVSSWKTGDRILFTSTDFDWRQAEVKTKMACDDCEPNQIRLDSPFQYTHYGRVTYGIDERGVVALLSRNIKIQGQLEDACYFHDSVGEELCSFFNRDTFGGHVKAVMNSTTHVEGAELKHMGQQHVQGSYPLHFHMMNNASGAWFRNNSIYDSLARCLTVHGTYLAEASDNVCYQHLGHGFFLEDAVEQDILLKRNLAVGTQHGALLLSDRKSEWCSVKETACDALSSFWITHANNRIIDNVAAGSDRNGFMVVFADRPLGPSANASWLRNNSNSKYYPFQDFSGNTVHSCHTGVFFSSRISTGEGGIPENGLIMKSPNYDPRDPPIKSGNKTTSLIVNMTMYKNFRNTWVKPGNLIFDYCSFADSDTGFTGGTNSKTSMSKVRNSRFIADTDNKGQPFTFKGMSMQEVHLDFSVHEKSNPTRTRVGVAFYQGPMLVENCYFGRYRNIWFADHLDVRLVRPAGALSWNMNNNYRTVVWTATKNITFDECDNTHDTNWVFRGNESLPGWVEKDGSRGYTFRDMDGSVTGQAKTQVVNDRPFLTGAECSPRPWGNMSACPYKYVQVKLEQTDGALDKNNFGNWPVIVRRDDVPEDPFHQEGKTQNSFSFRVNRSYTITFNASAGAAPIVYHVEGFNVELGDIVRIGICMPEGTTRFDIQSTYPVINNMNPYINATSLADLDSDRTGRMFYYNVQRGILYFMLISNGTRQCETEDCPGGHCINHKITRLDGSNVTRDCGTSSPIVDTSSWRFRERSAATTPPSVPTPKECSGTNSGEGLGAPVGDVLEASPFNPTCNATEPPTGRGERRGCFLESWSDKDVHYLPTETESMTPTWCQIRCYHRGYVYGALAMGKRCTCGNKFGTYGALPNSKCSKACTGDSETTCGSSSRSKIEVYTTGLAPTSGPARCGPNNEGEMSADNMCLYLAYQRLSMGEAQRLCARLGGNLVAIKSQEKQTSVEHYLQDRQIPDDSSYKVWTGLKHMTFGTEWEFMDGTLLMSLDFDHWKSGSGSDPDKHFVVVAEQSKRFHWWQTKDNIFAYPLCDLPEDPLPKEECGENGAGRRLRSSGTCYLVLDLLTSQEIANYKCHLEGGTLVDSPGNRAAQEALAHTLYRVGKDQEYWTKKNNKVMAYVDNIYTKTTVTTEHLAGALCVLENRAGNCLSGWLEYNGSCYLTLHTVVKSYIEGAALCEMNSRSGSHLVRVDNAGENTFVANMIANGTTGTSHVLMGLHYNFRDDNFVWGNGQRAEFENWKPQNGKTNLGEGSCAVLSPDDSDYWLNADCDSLKANLVCEMPALA